MMLYAQLTLDKVLSSNTKCATHERTLIKKYNNILSVSTKIQRDLDTEANFSF